MPKKKTQNQFIAQCISKYGDTYDYSKCVYVNDCTKLTIICRKHGYFQQTPSNHLSGFGCKLCGFEKRALAKTITQDECLIRFREKHGNRYGYDKVDYFKQDTPVTITCFKHGDFEQLPLLHWNGNGCRVCGYESTAHRQRMTTTEFIKRANEVHSNKYDYSDTVYVRGHGKVTIRCDKHGLFEQDAFNHLNGFGCKQCSPVGYSSPAIEWLNCMSVIHGIHIQHAENGGETLIPNTLYRVDGYSNDGRVWEFDGDYYHGNPKMYPRDGLFPHSKNGITFGDMFNKTVRKKEKLASLGYNIISIWESEWKCAKRSIIRLQRIFRFKRC